MNYLDKYTLFINKIKEIEALKFELLNVNKKELSFGERKILQHIEKLEVFIVKDEI